MNRHAHRALSPIGLYNGGRTQANELPYIFGCFNALFAEIDS